MNSNARVSEQLCFSLYATSRAVTGAYRKGLAKLGLTYPQYVTLLALWEKDGLTVKELGDTLDLDSGTLSPLLRRMERERLVRKQRGQEDEREVRVYLTEESNDLRQGATAVRCQVEEKVGLSPKEMTTLRETLEQLRQRVSDS